MTNAIQLNSREIPISETSTANIYDDGSIVVMRAYGAPVETYSVHGSMPGPLRQALIREGWIERSNTGPLAVDPDRSLPASRMVSESAPIAAAERAAVRWVDQSEERGTSNVTAIRGRAVPRRENSPVRATAGTPRIDPQLGLIVLVRSLAQSLGEIHAHLAHLIRTQADAPRHYYRDSPGEGIYNDNEVFWLGGRWYDPVEDRFVDANTEILHSELQDAIQGRLIIRDQSGNLKINFGTAVSSVGEYRQLISRFLPEFQDVYRSSYVRRAQQISSSQFIEKLWNVVEVIIHIHPLLRGGQVRIIRVMRASERVHRYAAMVLRQRYRLAIQARSASGAARTPRVPTAPRTQGPGSTIRRAAARRRRTRRSRVAARGLQRFSQAARNRLHSVLANPAYAAAISRIRSQYIIDFINRFYRVPGFRRVITDYARGGSWQVGARFVMRYVNSRFRTIPSAMRFEVGNRLRRIDLFVNNVGYEFKNVMRVNAADLQSQLRHDLGKLLSQQPDLSGLKWVFAGNRGLRLAEIQGAMRRIIEQAFRNHPRKAELLSWVRSGVDAVTF